MKSFIFQKGWVTPATKKKREAEAANATLQARRRAARLPILARAALPALLAAAAAARHAPGVPPPASPPPAAHRPALPPARRAAPQVTGAVGWRKDGLRYKKNEARAGRRRGAGGCSCRCWAAAGRSATRRQQPSANAQPLPCFAPPPLPTNHLPSPPTTDVPGRVDRGPSVHSSTHQPPPSSHCSPSRHPSHHPARFSWT